MNWIDAALGAIESGRVAVLVTIAQAAGSTPREAGVKMLVLDRSIVGSVGGGQLEMSAMETARQMISQGGATRRLIRQILGPDLGQCCGGAISLLLETLGADDRPWLAEARARAGHSEESWLVTPETGAKSWLDRAGAEASNWPLDRAACVLPGERGWRVIERVVREEAPLWLFGAGHVGRALARILADLPFAITWLDSRDDAIPEDVPAEIAIRPGIAVAEAVAHAPRNTLFLVMTHSHELDFEICERILRRGDFGFLGLIGSATKRARFQHRFKERGHSPALLDRLICPIGLAQVQGKQPMAIAVAVAGQLMTLRARLEREQDGRAAHRAEVGHTLPETG